MEQSGVPNRSSEEQETDNVEQCENPKHATWKRFIGKVGIDIPILIVMFKGSIPPIIGIAMYQSAAISSYFTTQGYLIPIISVLAVAILPRGRFIQNLILSLFLICVGSAVSLLIIWSSIQARNHTSTTSPQDIAMNPPPYNSSQSAVCAIWLFVNIWLANFMRAKLPSFNLPVVIYSILVNTSATAGPTIVTTAEAEAFVKELLLAMLFGMGLATGVSLFVFPITSRMVVMGELKGLIGLLRKDIELQEKYLASLAKNGMSAFETINGKERDASQEKLSPKEKKRAKVRRGNAKCITKEAKAAKELEETLGAIKVSTAKMHGDMTFAKRDIAWGKLDAKDLSQAFTLIQNVMIPIVAIGSVMDILRRVVHHGGLSGKGEAAAENNWEKQVWYDAMEQMHSPFQILAEIADQGLEHAAICLEVFPRTRDSKQPAKNRPDVVDVEANGDQVNPGEEGFGSLLDEKIRKFSLQKGNIAQAWVRERPLMPDEAKSSELHSLKAGQSNQAPLYVLLYMEQLMLAAGEAIRDLVNFADKKVEDGTMSHKCIILPSESQLWKWLVSVFKNQDPSVKQSSDIMEAGYIYYADGYDPKKDPEHLPPTSVWQYLGNELRKMSAGLGSKESVFGFRVACAAMTVGILAFLEKTQKFYQDQRLSWAIFTIALGMTITTGQSIFGFLCRIGGTCLAMIFSIAIWYIVDQKTPGVIVFLWLFIFVEYYFIKFPRFISAVMITIITQIIIIGYELQVRQIGKAVATSTGQPYYPVITSTIRSQAEDTGGNINSKASPAYFLWNARRKIFGKAVHLMSSMRSHIEWQRWELNMGGRFPIETYREMMMHCSHILTYLTLMSYAITHPPRILDRGDAGDGISGASYSEANTQDMRWRRALAEALPGVEPVHHTIMSTLTLLSGSMFSGRSLPPTLPLPRPYDMMRRLVLDTESDDDDVPHFRDSWGGHVHPELTTIDLRPGTSEDVGEKREPDTTVASKLRVLDSHNPKLHSYAEFVVMQVCSTLVCNDLEGLARAVSRLVGVVDFGFRVDASGVDNRIGDNSSSRVRRRG
ncbi:uncharacterized protein TRIVIDRAFT_50219 [Trichoderma virens Gv29-8]|uniref:Uncharacterized protein n=1 Tax=Hypocrea virens (strain Gv29-8 / FGSC 10586) TaxID=413071 RepID=G9MGL7_HYPVG|nr:uncharacterized protein TRIVIDRAFT_50219 [Trichoderma virens Gv29-8]EHK26664.1 hypothetical protein TRIVIDRAFT_50219 [Trichoderma virens Gv29-8]